MFTEEQFKFIKNVYTEAFMSADYNQICRVCPMVVSLPVCHYKFCECIKTSLDYIVNNWEEEEGSQDT